MVVMRLSIRYILLAVSVIIGTSCVDQLREKERTGYEGDYVLDLSVSCMKPGTKTVTGPKDRDGIEEYNENKVEYVDWYIFKSSSDTGEALLHGRADVTQEEGATEGLKIVEALDMSKTISETHQMSFYVFTIANYPDPEEDDADETVGETNPHDDLPTTLSDLNSLVLTAGFNNSSFTKQKSFVMIAGETVTFEQKGLTTVTNKLSRLASKVSVNMNVTPAIDQFTILPNGQQAYMRTWYPDLASIEVYMSFANAETTVSATPVSYNQDTFFTYYRTGFVPGFSYTGSESYSKTVPTLPEGHQDDPWTVADWNWKVNGSPFYSYPMKWTLNSPQAPFIKVILKWSAYNEDVTEETVQVDGGDEIRLVPGRSQAAAKADKTINPSAETEDEKNKQEFFYKIPLPVDNSGNGVLNANDWYDLIIDLAILGSTADELPVELAGQYSVVDWNDTLIKAGGELKQGRYLATATDKYYMYGVNEIEIPVSSSHALATDASVVKKREIYYDGEWRTSVQGQNLPYQVRTFANRTLTVTAPGDGRSILKFENILTNTVGSNLDCYKMRFTLEVKHSDEAGPSKTIVIEQYPPIYVDSRKTQNSRSVFINNYDYADRAKWAFNNDKTAAGHLGAIGGSSSGKSVKTIISVSSLANLSTDPYNDTQIANPVIGNPVIGDPRIPLNYPSNPYDNRQKWGDRDLGDASNGYLANYLIAATGNRNVIAPKFMISSGLSGTNNVDGETKVDWVHNAERCAAYQEDGYPAGRWRLPTEAEIMFVYFLGRRYGLLVENPFTDSSNYWANSGRRIQGGSFVSAQGNFSSRCVYDLWYWGDEPVLTTSTTPSITQWSGFMTE